MANKVLNILVVEDDEVDTMNVQRAFERAELQHNLFFATNGEEALEFLNNQSFPKPRVILLDINMPRMNGIEFLTEIRKNPEWKGMPVFVMTTSDNDSDMIQAYELNVAGYIVKPLRFENFAEAITTLDRYWASIEL